MMCKFEPEHVTRAVLVIAFFIIRGANNGMDAIRAFYKAFFFKKILVIIMFHLKNILNIGTSRGKNRTKRFSVVPT